MNKRITSLLLCFVMVFTMLATAVPALAAGPFDLKVTADKTEASPGDTITFTITLGPVSDMGSMQLDLVIPEGLTYVANSGKLADGLKETLGFDAADWTDATINVEGKNRINGGASAADYSSDKDTVLATFQCTVDDGASGTLKVGLDNLEFYSCQTWEDHTAEYQVIMASVNVTPPAPATYTVSFDANGGTGSMGDVTGVSGEYTLPANGFTAPDGKQFKAWSVGGVEKAVGDKITVTANTTVTAVWENTPVVTYTVSFDANGGTGSMGDVTGVSGEYTLPANGFTAPDGKQFKAWSVGGVEKAVGDKITVTANTTVTAVWENTPVVTYTVSFDANGGTGSMGDVTGVTSSYTLPACTFTAPSGKQFKGWATSASGTVITGTSITVTADTKLYAIWTYTSSGGYYYAPTAAVVPDMPMLYRGCTGDAVKTLQDKLNALGYNSGSVDGIFGAKTYAAVTAFQKANSLGVDGIVGKLTWGKLYGVSPAMPVETTTVVGRPMVSYGSRGDAVRKLQELLNALGYDCGSVDGIFGSKTKAAVLAFQKANGLGVDGIVGPLTWGKLV